MTTARTPALAPIARGGIPANDPAYPILAGIVEIVPASAWSFAHIKQNGSLRAEWPANGAELNRLGDELQRQRNRTPCGPKIAATLRSSAGMPNGITLIFADARADYGIMTLMRDAELPPFSSIEVGLLTFALDAGSDRLAALRLQPGDARAGGATVLRAQRTALAVHDEAFYILDGNLEIVLAWSTERQGRIAATDLPPHAAERLPAMLEASVRELTAGWATSPIKEPGIARPVPFLVVRTQPMSGPAGSFVGVRVDRFQPPNSLTGAALRFHISPREVQVLALVLDGDHLDQIAARLHITSSTVQDHIKSMLDKTASRNRSELIARVLGWEPSPAERA